LTVVCDSIQQGEIKAEIAFVFCSREPGEAKESDLFIKLVNQYQLPLVCYSYQKFKTKRGTTGTDQVTLPEWRLDYDRQVMKKLHSFTPDLCVLAGYMLIVGKEMCQQYNMINLHPAAPGGPTGTWQEVIWQLIDSKARTTGVMMHLVTPELDKGPPVSYCTFSLRGKPFDTLWQTIEELPASSTRWREARKSLFHLIRKHGLTREFPLIVSTIKAFSQDRIRITEDKKIIDSEGKSIIGYYLTSEIDEKVSRVLSRSKG
jgi:folate-dependent phosphoribosylglycinamide formyltransferase PurN